MNEEKKHKKLRGKENGITSVRGFKKQAGKIFLFEKSTCKERGEGGLGLFSPPPPSFDSPGEGGRGWRGRIERDR